MPLCLMRIWCRKFDAWLSFSTASADRYLIGEGGYFVELSDGTLVPVNPRVVFPTVDWFSSVSVDDLAVQSQFGPDVRLISVPASGPRSGKPHAVMLEALLEDLETISPFDLPLTQMERYIVLRLYESGLVSESDLKRVVAHRGSNQTVAQDLIESGLVQWEPMLACCLDTRSPSRLDPPASREMGQRNDWELTGEILIAMGKLSRANLVQALQIKRQGSRAVGEILTSMGACSQEDIEQCLDWQREIRHSLGTEVALIGQLLITRGVITFEDLDSAIRNQRIGRQSLEKILLAMGACTNRDVEDFVRANNWHSFQEEIDDVRLGHWLVKVGTISRQQLEEALRIQSRGRQVLGELLVALRLCSSDEIDDVLRVQKDVRDDYKTGVEKIGSLLLKKRKIDEQALDKALKLQSTGRQRIGCILVALGTCTEEDLGKALEIQRKWREKTANVKDRLGDVLIAQGTISPGELERALERHMADKLPLGRVLIEEGIATPEEIIAALIVRDDQRQCSFRNYLKEQSGPAVPSQAVTTAAGRAMRDTDESVLHRLSSWMGWRKSG